MTIRILITGSAGLVGRALEARNADAIGLDLRAAGHGYPCAKAGAFLRRTRALAHGRLQDNSGMFASETEAIDVSVVTPCHGAVIGAQRVAYVLMGNARRARRSP